MFSFYQGQAILTPLQFKTVLLHHRSFFVVIAHDKANAIVVFLTLTSNSLDRESNEKPGGKLFQQSEPKLNNECIMGMGLCEWKGIDVLVGKLEHCLLEIIRSWHWHFLTLFWFNLGTRVRECSSTSSGVFASVQR